jgi:peptide chain release factor subunit 1
MSMALTEKQKHDLKKLVKELENYRGRHTELITVYVPVGYDIVKIIQHLDQEKGTASNIKSAATRKNVITALEKMIQHLRLFKKTPEHGLAAFSGNVTEKEGQEDFKVWSVEPPVPLNTRIYRCDKEFQLELLREMLDVKEVYGLVIIDRRDANIAYLKGKTIVPLKSTHSEVPGKTRAGGQSAARFERLRDGAAKDHFKKVADHVKDQFLENKNLKGILVGGPGPTKYTWIEGGFLTDQLKQKVIAVKDIGYTGEFGLQELVDKSQDILANEDIAAEKKIMARFFDTLAKTPNKVSYGEKQVMGFLKIGVVETLLLSEELEDDEIEEFEKEAGNVGSNVKIISIETREGVQLKELGKVAAILRYEQHS